MNIQQRDAARLVRSIGQTLERSGPYPLLIVDEGQNLVDDAVNQLRHFVDKYKTGVALLGNSETYGRFQKDWSQGPKYGQLKRRIFKRMQRGTAERQDLIDFIGAWGVTDAEQTKYLLAIGKKPGAMGQIDMTLKLATMSAMGAQEELSISHLRAAWENRDVEVV